MVYQSNITLPKGTKAKAELVEGRKDVWVIENAYEGSYEYFKPSKPELPATPSKKPSESPAGRK